jgi:hypothetical protein
MGEPSLGAPAFERPTVDLLGSWKEIATYLKRDVTTVQRWEKREGMPVHRHLHDRMGSVYAFRAELDSWMQTRKPSPGQENGDNGISPAPPAEPARPAASVSRHRWRLVLTLAAAVSVVLAIGAGLWLKGMDYFWRSPIAGARFQTVTDFDGLEQAAALFRDGHFVAFLSDRDGQMDVWVTQVGSGEFHNLTHGSAPELVNPSVRTVRFSPDASLVTYWVRKPGGNGGAKSGGEISVWAVPTLGGAPRPYLEGVAEFDWSRDGSQLAYHTPGPETRSSYQTATSDRKVSQSSLRHPGSIVTFRCGRPMGHSFISCWAPPGQVGHMAHSPRRRRSRTNHVASWRRESSGPARSANDDISCNRF